MRQPFGQSARISRAKRLFMRGVGDVPFSDEGLLAMGFPPPGTDWRFLRIPASDDKRMLNIALDRLAGHGMQLPTLEDQQQWLNLVRLTEHAVRCYGQACDHLEEYAKHGHDGRVSPFLRAVDEFETCMTNAHRAVLAAKDLHEAGVLDVALLPSALTRRLHDVRRAIEHIDGRIRSRRATQSRALHLLFPVEEGLVIDNAEITWEELQQALTLLRAAVGRATPIGI